MELHQTTTTVGNLYLHHVHCWEISKNGTALNTTPKASFSNDQRVLYFACKDDGTIIFSGVMISRSRCGHFCLEGSQ
ncbi:hypothetical protein RYX36_020273 [Vicia faba]